ncbi:glycosyl transferase, partial [Jimgerdemannia flammicorona]
MSTLWKTVKSFMRQYSSLIPKKNRLDFISDDGGRTYNTCYFGSNLEIGSLNFFRSSAYLRFFEYLDRTGGFFYE